MNPSERPPLVASLVGPTASGKTAVAVALSRLLPIEVVSADSRQVYRRLDVGTAKPTAEERAAVPHWMVDVAEPTERFSAARFGEEARAAFEEIRARGKLPVLVGGSGLYLRAAEEGLFEGPEADAEVRARLGDVVEREGVEALHARLAAVDAETAERLHPRDVVRVTRALEVWELTGTALSEHHRRHRDAPSPVTPLRFGLEWPVEALDARIAARTEAMLAAGWEDEVRGLVAAGLGESPGMDALGYPEVRALVAGEIGRAEAAERITRATRQFAKRQRTWFRAVAGVVWLPAAGRSAEELAGEIAGRVEAAGRE